LNTDAALWSRVPEPNPATHFLLTAGELLVAHACSRVRDISHAGTAYRVAGLSTVFAYPDFRGRGLGERVAGAATDYIRASGADCAMLFCGPRVCSLYERLGWEHVHAARITYGDPPTPKSDNLVLMLFLSDKGRDARQVFEHEVVHVGPHTW
jgi:GNAT superfamily N-acetyltransferase